jgi:spore coat polysaccharide biosynthesis predicted glycosyltransferase SpsG/RimJ/RimL family protein N-acetyltransferase
VVDGYPFDGPYVERLRSAGARVAMVDDLPRLARYDVDLLIDQNPGALRQPYVAPSSRLLLGPRFALLRPGFAGGDTAARPDGRRILVSAGASDVGGVTGRVLEALAPRTDLQVTAVIGAANRGGAAVRAAFANRPHIRFVDNAVDMPALMAGADLAVASVGIMLWELAALGVPTLMISSTGIQHDVARTAHECGAWQWLGDAAALTSGDVGDAVHALVADHARRAEMSRLGRAIVDGRGAERVAHALLAERPEWTVRPAASDDAEAIWEIVADPDVRRHAFTTGSFAFAGHHAWFAARLASPDSRIWVAVQDDCVGAFVRFDRAGEQHAVIAIAVARACRGRGLATRLLRETTAAAALELGVSSVRGLVLTGNAPSRQVFERAGFRVTDSAARLHGHDCIVFEAHPRRDEAQRA